jgi:chromosome segregation ATPase
MRRILWLAAVAIFVLSAAGPCPSQDQQQGQDASQAYGAAAQSPAAAPASGTSAPQQESLGEAARKAREQKKEAPKAAKVYTNENLPVAGGISTVGVSAAAAAAEGAPPAVPAAKDEKAWREKFAALRHKLEQDQADLEVMERELAVLSVQKYDDPNQAMREQYTREDINKKTADIETRKKQVEADKQAIDDAESELRKAGGDSGWAR